MRIQFTTQVEKQLKFLKRKNPKLYLKVQKKLLLLKKNPNYPSLRLHKLKGELKNTWSVSIERDFRMIYFVENDDAVFFSMGTHDEVYKRD